MELYTSTHQKKCSVQYGEQGICSKLQSKLDAEAIDFVSIGT